MICWAASSIDIISTLPFIAKKLMKNNSRVTGNTSCSDLTSYL